jgi:uncharacterized protein involved in exopolysaccharide biosynthesis
MEKSGMTENNDIELSFGDYIRVLKRRRHTWAMIVGSVLLIGIAIAFQMRPIYESAGVLLAEQPEVPEYVVRSIVPDYPEERVRIITQRVLTNDNLERIIEAHGLYPELRSSRNDALREFRDNLSLSSEDPELLENIMGTSNAATAMAFSLAFADPSPVVARDVATDLVALYLEENQRARRELAAGTTSFLNAEADRIEQQIAAREVQIAGFKRANAGSLPDLRDANLQQLDRTERELEATEQEIRSLRGQQSLYASELAQLSPRVTLTDEEGATILGPEDRLKVLQRRYVQLSAIYSQDHPDVIAVRREIAALNGSAGTAGASDSAALQSELAAREDELAAARDRYSSDHPDVMRLERTVQNLRATLASAPGGSAARRATDPDNPQYIQRRVQLEATTADLNAALTHRDALRERLSDLEVRLSGTPSVEREYTALMRGYEQLLTQADEIQGKLREAQIALNLETTSQGDRFTVLQAPVLPSQPARPNRIAVLLLTVAAAVILGVAGVAIRERTDTSLRTPADLTRYLGIPPLVAIPFVNNRADLRRRARQRLLTAAAVCAWAGAAVFMIITPAG